MSMLWKEGSYDGVKATILDIDVSNPEPGDPVVLGRGEYEYTGVIDKVYQYSNGIWDVDVLLDDADGDDDDSLMAVEIPTEGRFVTAEEYMEVLLGEW